MSYWDIAGLVSKFLSLCGVAMVVGGGFSIWLDAYVGNPFRQRVLTYALTGAVTGMVSACLFFLVQVGAINQTGTAGMWDWQMTKILATTGLGHATALRVLGCLMTIGMVTVLFRAGNTSVRGNFASLGTIVLFALQCALLVLSFPMMGHIANLTTLAQAALVVHVLAAFLWIGTLYPLWQLGMEDDNERVRRTMVQFGEIAKFMLIVLIASGIYLIISLHGSLKELFESTYGQSLVLKLVGVTALVTLGALNKFLLVPNLQKGSTAVTRLRRSIQVEMIVALVILALTTYFTTAIGPPS